MAKGNYIGGHTVRKRYQERTHFFQRRKVQQTPISSWRDLIRIPVDLTPSPVDDDDAAIKNNKRHKTI
jgi:hypothetical protein